MLIRNPPENYMYVNTLHGAKKEHELASLGTSRVRGFGDVR